MFKLQIELIPKTCWDKNLRSVLKQSDWDKIRKAVYEKENMTCHTCDTKVKLLNAHEVWEFNEDTHTQKLIDIIGVCTVCHNSIHYGRSQMLGFGEDAIKQFMYVNDCDIIDFQNAALEAKLDYDRRSKINDWTLDLSYIESQGYSIKTV